MRHESVVNYKVVFHIPVQGDCHALVTTEKMASDIDKHDEIT